MEKAGERLKKEKKKMKIRKIAAMMLAFSMTCSLSACSQTSGKTSGTTTSGASGEQHYKLRVAGGNTTGTGYAYWLAVANLMSKYSDKVSLELVESTGSSDSLDFVQYGEADLAIASAVTFLNRYTGADGTEGGDIIKPVMDLYSAYVQVICPSDTDMETWSDLSGHSFNLNVANNVGNEIGKEILECLDLKDVREFNVSNNDAVDMINEGTLDAHIIVVGLNNSTVMQVAGGPRGVKTLTCTDEEAEKVREALPVLQQKTLPAGNAGLEYEVPTLSSSTSMFARDDVPAEAVKEICKVVYEHHDELVGACAVAEETTPELTVNTFGTEEIAPFHPGAKEYFQETGAIK